MDVRIAAGMLLAAAIVCELFHLRILKKDYEAPTRVLFIVEAGLIVAFLVLMLHISYASG